MALLRGLVIWTLLLLSLVLSQSEAGHFPEVDHQAYRVLDHLESNPDGGDSAGGNLASRGRSVTYWPHESVRHQKSVATSRRNHVDEQQQQQLASIKRLNSNNSSSNNTNNIIIDNNSSHNNSDVHCIQAPGNLQQICSAALGWSSRMRLPNFLGHKSHVELSNELTAMNSVLNAVNVIDCKAIEQFKLLLCATLSPICIDVVVPPCKHLCLRAKSSCRQALQLHGLDWPKSLDCRRFPSAPEVCINRQPVFSQPVSSQSDNTSVALAPAKYDDEGHAIGQNLDAQDRLDDQQSVSRPQATTANTTATTTTTTTNSIAKRRRKEKKDRRVKAKATTTTTTTTTAAPIPSEPIETTGKPPQPTANDFNDTAVTSDNRNDNHNNNNGSSSENMTSASSVTPIETDNATSTTTTSDSSKLSPYTQSSSPSTPPNNMVELLTTTTTTTVLPPPPPTHPLAPHTTSSVESPAASQVNLLTSSSSQPAASVSTTLTQDLTQYLCSNLPDWLVKTKLTDNQLMSATKKRKLRIKSYRQIFGHPLSLLSPSNRSTTARGSPLGPAVASAAATTTTTTTGVNSGKATITSSLHVNLSNFTKFIYPMGANLYGQLMSDSAQSQSSSTPLDSSNLSHSTSPSSLPSAEALIKSSSKTYLIFGVNNLATTTAGGSGVTSQSNNNNKIATFVVLWPGAKFNKGLDTQASSDIVRAYRDFKTRGSSICHQPATASPLTYDVDRNDSR